MQEFIQKKAPRGRFSCTITFILSPLPHLLTGDGEGLVAANDEDLIINNDLMHLCIRVYMNIAKTMRCTGEDRAQQE